MEGHDEGLFANRIDLGHLRDTAARIREEVGKAVVGQTAMVDLLLTAVLADGHVLIEGVPGVAKTLTAKTLAKIVTVGFSRIQFTPDLMPSDVIGTNVFNVKTNEFEFRRGPVFSNLVLIDEINRAPAKTQAALFEVMEERQITVDGTTYPMEPPFLVLATQNPVEQEGTYRLPEAQLDRFLFKINVGYPSPEEELEILAGFHERKNSTGLMEVTPLFGAAELAAFRAAVRQITIDRDIMQYIARISHATRQDSALYLGASPRASIAMLSSAKAYAALQGRDFVTPEDVKTMAPPVLRHRVMLTAEKEMEGLSVEDVVERILEKAEVPR